MSNELLCNFHSVALHFVFISQPFTNRITLTHRLIFIFFTFYSIFQRTFD